MRSEVVHALKELIKSGNVEGQLTVAESGFQVDNIYPIVKHLFSEKAVKTLETKTEYTLHQWREWVGPKGLDQFYLVTDLMAKLGIESCYFAGDIGYKRHFDKVNCFGSACKREDIGLAVEKVINAVNQVADLDFTKASLMPLGGLSGLLYLLVR